MRLLHTTCRFDDTTGEVVKFAVHREAQQLDQSAGPCNHEPVHGNSWQPKRPTALISAASVFRSQGSLRGLGLNLGQIS